VGDVTGRIKAWRVPPKPVAGAANKARERRKGGALEAPNPEPYTLNTAS